MKMIRKQLNIDQKGYPQYMAQSSLVCSHVRIKIELIQSNLIFYVVYDKFCIIK